MQNKNKIGALILLGGVALIGMYWFKKNKTNIASTQLKGLQNLINFYKTSGGNEETFIKGNSAIKPVKQSEMVTILTTQVKKDIDKQTNLAINCSMPYLANQNNIDCTEYCKTNPLNCPSYTNQISQNMQNFDYSSLSNLGLAGVTFNVAPKK
jgi:hypothetical protein